MLVDKQSELMSDLLFTVHQHGGDDVTWKPPIEQVQIDAITFQRTQIPFFKRRFHCRRRCLGSLNSN